MIQGLNPGQIGTSEAGKRIRDAGSIYQTRIHRERLQQQLVEIDRKIDAHWRGPLRMILDEVSAKHGLTPKDMRSARRPKRITDARLEFYYRAALETDQSMPAIGNVVNKDHSTVIIGCRRYAVKHSLPMPRGW